MAAEPNEHIPFQGLYILLYTQKVKVKRLKKVHLLLKLGCLLYAFQAIITSTADY